jgi:hypothetical protein
MASKKYVASEILLEAAKRHQIHLSVLVAETGLWAAPHRPTGQVVVARAWFSFLPTWISRDQYESRCPESDIQ